MGTKRLLTLLALVAVLGGVSVYYITQVVPQSVEDEMLDTMTLPSDMAPVTEDAVTNETKATGVVSVTADEPASVPAVSSAPAGSIEADMDALANMGEPTYDDSSLDSTFGAENSASLTESYDF